MLITAQIFTCNQESKRLSRWKKRILKHVTTIMPWLQEPRPSHASWRLQNEALNNATNDKNILTYRRYFSIFSLFSAKQVPCTSSLGEKRIPQANDSPLSIQYVSSSEKVCMTEGGLIPIFQNRRKQCQRCLEWRLNITHKNFYKNPKGTTLPRFGSLEFPNLH